MYITLETKIAAKWYSKVFIVRPGLFPKIQNRTFSIKLVHNKTRMMVFSEMELVV